MGLVTTVLRRTPKRIAMVGCGPLPLTGLSYVEFAHSEGQDLEVLNIDIVSERIEASRKVCSLLDRTKGMDFLLADGRDPIPQLADYDVILLASVAGITDDDKSRMIASIAQVMVRTRNFDTYADANATERVQSLLS